VCFRYRQKCIVLPRGESETATEHCRYIIPTARKIYRTFDKMKRTYDNDSNTANAKVNRWRTVRRNRQSKGDMVSPMTAEQTEGGGNQRDSLSLQKGYMNVRFMFGTNKSTNSSATFNLARLIKNFVIAGRNFDENFCILPLYGGGAISKPQDVLNSKDAITVYYRHRLAGNNLSGKMRIQSTSTIAQMKHATSSFKQYLLKDRVHIINAQLGPEEAVVLGWTPGSHRAFSFRYSM
jgi:hypothetical protein